MQEFLAMGGYGFYVWGSYGVMAVIMIVEMLQLRMRRRALVRWLRRMTRVESQEMEKTQ